MAVAQITALVVLGAFFSPIVRAVLIWIIVLGIIVLLCLIGYRVFSKKLEPFSATQPVQKESRNFARDLTIHQHLHSLDWFHFELLLTAVFEQEGYSAERSGGANPEGGIDVVVTKDQQTFAVQCKHWKTWNVGVKDVRQFLGALTDRGIQRGIFVTLKGYSDDARKFAAKHYIQLIDEAELLQRLGVLRWQSNNAILAVLNDKRKICPKCESEMVLRTAKHGRNIGQQFWGCLGFPKCRYTTYVDVEPRKTLNPSFSVPNARAPL